MDNEVFTAGVLPGAPKYDFEVKFLICYLLSSVSEPVSFNQLSVTFQKTGFVNYFEFSALISEMLEQGHIRPAREGAMMYELTDHGMRTAQNFTKSVPLSVRERCFEELKRQLKLARRQRENEVNIERTQDGYKITLIIHDIGTPLLSLTLFMPTLRDCENVRRRFLNDPLYFYTGVIALTTGDVETMGHLHPSGEELFD